MWGFTRRQYLGLLVTLLLKSQPNRTDVGGGRWGWGGCGGRKATCLKTTRSKEKKISEASDIQVARSEALICFALQPIVCWCFACLTTLRRRSYALCATQLSVVRESGILSAIICLFWNGFLPGIYISSSFCFARNGRVYTTTGVPIMWVLWGGWGLGGSKDWTQ